MIKTLINLQDLRRKIYTKAKTDKSWRFWGIYVHICKLETLKASYKQAKQNNGSPGVDGLTFEEIEKGGLEKFLEGIQKELKTQTYTPSSNRKHEIPKSGGKTRTLSIPTIRDRVVEGALKLILESIFEADFSEGSFGYRPKRTAGGAIDRLTKAVHRNMTRVLDVDLKSYFDTIRHDILLSKIAKRLNDNSVLRLLKQILKSGGKKGVPQGGPLSPLLSNIYLTEVDKMLERAKSVTSGKGFDHIEYVRWADDLVILVDCHSKWDWVWSGVNKRLREELTKLDVTLNEEKTCRIDLKAGESVNFLGFQLKRIQSHSGKRFILKLPRKESKKTLYVKIKEVFRRNKSQPIIRVINQVNRILRGWVNYFRIGNSSKIFRQVKDWVEKKMRRHLMESRQRKGFGWKRWNKNWFYDKLGLYSDYKIKYYQSSKVSSSQ